jgi:uncharacterized protein (UPF0333 family)
MLRHKRAQSTAEYAIVIALVVGAAMAMQIYLKRGMQAGIKYAVDKAANNTGQYEPYYLESSYTNTEKPGYTYTEETKLGGGVERETLNKRTERSGYQTSKAPEQQ